MGNGPNYSVRVGRTNQSPKDVAANVLEALTQVLAIMSTHEEIEFEHVCQATLKTKNSPELPIYNFLSKEDLEAVFT